MTATQSCQIPFPKPPPTVSILVITRNQCELELYHIGQVCRNLLLEENSDDIRTLEKSFYNFSPFLRNTLTNITINYHQLYLSRPFIQLLPLDHHHCIQNQITSHLQAAFTKIYNRLAAAGIKFNCGR